MSVLSVLDSEVIPHDVAIGVRIYSQYQVVLGVTDFYHAVEVAALKTTVEMKLLLLVDGVHSLLSHQNHTEKGHFHLGLKFAVEFMEEGLQLAILNAEQVLVFVFILFL